MALNDIAVLCHTLRHHAAVQGQHKGGAAIGRLRGMVRAGSGESARVQVQVHGMVWPDESPWQCDGFEATLGS